jgi:Holliday junction resolvasome RuvABC endonuclease subunit
MTPRSLILGLDVSARRIGWAIINYDDATPIKHGTEHTASGDDLTNRRVAFLEIARTADALGDVCAVIIEDAYAGPNRAGTVAHALSVGNVEGLAAARWPGVLVDRVRPAVWRSVIGVASTGKDCVGVWAARLVGVEVGEDAADALGVACAGHVLIWQASSKEVDTDGQSV